MPGEISMLIINSNSKVTNTSSDPEVSFLLQRRSALAGPSRGRSDLEGEG